MGSPSSRFRRVLAAALAVLVALLVAALLVGPWGDGDAPGPAVVERHEAGAARKPRRRVAAPTPPEPERGGLDRFGTLYAPDPPEEQGEPERLPGYFYVFVRTTSGEPVEDVLVQLHDTRGRGAQVVTNAAGRAALLPRGAPRTVRILLSETQALRYLAVPPRELAPDAEETAIVLHEGVLLRGRLVAPDESPLASVHVSVRERPTDRFARSLTDDGGRFVVLLAQDASADVFLEGTGRRYVESGAYGIERGVELPWTGSWTGVEPWAGERVFRATALPTRDLRVRVETPDGRPVAGAEVTTRLGSWRPFDGPVRTGLDGRATLTGLVARERTVAVAVGEVTAPAGLWIAPDTVTLTPPDDEVVLVVRPAARVLGRVRCPDVVTMFRSGIEAWHGDESVAQVTSRSDGTFELALPADAPAPLRLTARMYGLQRVRYVGEVENVWPGAEDVVIEIAREQR